MNNHPIITTLMIVISIIVLINCTGENSEPNEIIDIENNISNFKPFRLSNLDCELEYVVLETTSEAMLMDIRSIDISGDHIVVSDRDKCLFFDRSGKFFSRIGSQGRGPGEYIYPAQVKIVYNKIFLSDPLKSELIIYNTKGELINIVKTPGGLSPSSSNWMPLTDSTYLVQIPNRTGNEKFRIALIDNNGEILEGFPNTTFFTPHTAGWNSNDLTAHFYNSNNNIYYKERLIDTIWQIKNDNLHPSYIINLGKYGFPVQYRELPLNLYFEKLTETIPITNVFASNEYIFFILGYGRKYPFTFFRESCIIMGIEPPGPLPYNIIGLYNKPKKEFFLVSPSNIVDQIEPTGIENDIDGGINFMPRYLVNDKLIVSWFEAYQLKMYVASESFKNSTPKYPEKKKELEELAASIDENDNPVLMLVKLKE